MNNAYAHLKLHNLKMEKLERIRLAARRTLRRPPEPHRSFHLEPPPAFARRSFLLNQLWLPHLTLPKRLWLRNPFSEIWPIP